MSTLSFNPDDAPVFDAPSAGRHHAVCCDIWDRGVIETPFGIRDVVRIYWQIDETESEGKFKGEPKLVSKDYTKSLHPNSTLRRDLEMWRGQPFDDGKITVDLEALIGKRATVVLTHNKRGNTVFANVDKVFRPGQGNDLEVSENYVRKYIRDMQDAPGESDASSAGSGDDSDFAFSPDDDLPF